MKRAYLFLGLLLSGCGTAATNPNAASDPLGSASSRGATERLAESAPVKSSDPLWESRRVGVVLTAGGEARGIERLWATVRRVELLAGQGDEAVASLSEENGTSVELCGLSGRLFPLGSAPLASARPVARVRLTLDGPLMRFAPGSPRADTIQLPEALPRDAAGRPQLTLTLEKTYQPGNEPLVLRVDLSKLDSTSERSPLSLSATTGIKGEPLVREWHGTIRGVRGEAPNQQLLIGTQRLTLAAGTSVLGNGKTSPALAEGQPVRVWASLDPASGVIAASRVSLGGEAGSSASGKVQSVDAAGQTFTLSLDDASGLIPGQRTVLVSLKDGVLLQRQGALPLPSAELWSSLKAGASVRLEGDYEPVSGAFLAARLALEAAGPGLITLMAPVSGGDEKSLTLGAPTAWNGFAPPAKGLPLTLSEATTLLGDDGAGLKSDGFAALAKERGVRVVGLLGKDGKVTATRLELLPKPAATPEPEKKPVEKPTGEPKAAPRP